MFFCCVTYTGCDVPLRIVYQRKYSFDGISLNLMDLSRIQCAARFVEVLWFLAHLIFSVTTITIAPSIGSRMVRGGGGPRNMKYKGPPMAAIFFMTSFNRDRGGGHGPPGPPLDPQLTPLTSPLTPTPDPCLRPTTSPTGWWEQEQSSGLRYAYGLLVTDVLKRRAEASITREACAEFCLNQETYWRTR